MSSPLLSRIVPSIHHHANSPFPSPRSQVADWASASPSIVVPVLDAIRVALTARSSGGHVCVCVGGGNADSTLW
jgi:hypothetical protein